MNDPRDVAVTQVAALVQLCIGYANGRVPDDDHARKVAEPVVDAILAAVVPPSDPDTAATLYYYIVTATMMYEGTDVVGLFLNRDHARQRAQSINDQQDPGYMLYDFCTIQTWTVGSHHVVEADEQIPLRG